MIYNSESFKEAPQLSAMDLSTFPSGLNAFEIEQMNVIASEQSGHRPKPISYDTKNRFGNITPDIKSPSPSQGYAVGLYMKDGSCMPKVIQVDPEHKSAERKMAKKNLRNQMKGDNVINSKCAVCQNKNKGIKKCNGCYSIWYCGQKCQKEDWTKHRDLCLKIKSQYRVAKYRPMYIRKLILTPTSPILSDSVIEANNNLTKKHFVIRVTLVENEKLDIHNQDRSFRGMLSKKDNVSLYNHLTSKISSEGFQGVEGYFHAIVEPGDKESKQFRINPENMFIETWSEKPGEEEILLLK